MNLPELRQRRETVHAEMTQLHQAAGQDGVLSPEQQSAWDTLEAEARSLSAQITRQAQLDDYDRRAIGTPLSGSGDRNLDREIAQFSLVRAVASQIPGATIDAGREREVSAEIARRAGRPFQGMAIPMAIFATPLEQRVMTTAAPGGGPGGNLIGTTLDAGNFIDPLRNALVVRSLGARVLAGLVGNLDISRQKASATGAWVAENAAISATDAQFDAVSFTPKHAGAISEWSRNLLLQTSPDVEQLMRADFTAVLARTLDLAAIAGTGSSNQPTGILSTSGIGNVAMGTNGGALTFDAVADLVGAVADANAEMGALGMATNTKVRRAAAKLKDSQNRPLGEDVVFQGVRRAYSNAVPSTLTKGTSSGNCSALVYGNWSDLIIALWSELDLLVNPYESTAYAKGNVQLRGMMTVDIGVRHPESFAAIKDILA